MKVRVRCKCCREWFERSKYEVGRCIKRSGGLSVYCSQNCFHQSKKLPPGCCIECNIQFRKRWNGSKCCGITCRINHNKRYLRNATNHSKIIKKILPDTIKQWNQETSFNGLSSKKPLADDKRKLVIVVNELKKASEMEDDIVETAIYLIGIYGEPIVSRAWSLYINTPLREAIRQHEIWD